MACAGPSTRTEKPPRAKVAEMASRRGDRAVIRSTSASIALAVAANRKGHATIGAAGPSPWLFPGGQPGQPISGARLTKRLDALGISPRQARSTALFQLAAEVPAAILARTLGLSTSVAVTWQRLSAGDWAAYAADVSRRPPQQSVPPRHQTPGQP